MASQVRGRWSTLSSLLASPDELHDGEELLVAVVLLLLLHLCVLSVECVLQVLPLSDLYSPNYSYMAVRQSRHFLLLCIV